MVKRERLLFQGKYEGNNAKSDKAYHKNIVNSYRFPNMFQCGTRSICTFELK